MNKVIGYVHSFLGMLIPEIEDINIKEIILYGSAARGEYSEESDVDIFVNLYNEKESGKIERIIEKILIKFYSSEIYKKWSLIGIKNEIKINIGILNKWKLKRSIISDGILLYGKYKQIPEKLGQFSLFVFNPIKNIAKRNRITRRLFGRSEKNYKTEGLIKKYSGRIISDRSFIVPLSVSQEIIKMLSKEKIDYKIYEILSDQFY